MASYEEKEMTIQRFNYRKLPAIVTVVAMAIIQVLSTSVATTSASPTIALADADLSAESRTLDAFVTDLVVFDKKNAELRKRASLTRTEFGAHEQSANDLKRRLSAIQDAVRETIRKLKASGQWENLDQTVLAKISDPTSQNFLRTEGGFKKILEDTASGLSNNANQISAPLDVLRNKVQGTLVEPNRPPLASLAVRVAYTPPRAMFARSLRCIIVANHNILIQAVGKKLTSGQLDQFVCYCGGDCGSAT
jgi:hypothetical protein